MTDWIAYRIKCEFDKYGASLPDEWHIIAANKIYRTLINRRKCYDKNHKKGEDRK